MIEYLDGGIGDMARFRTTPEGGFATLMINATGATSIKGTLLRPSATVDFGVSVQDEEYDTMAVMWSDGVPNGQPCWVVTTGQADVLLKNATAVTRQALMIASATDGRAEPIATPPPPPNQDTHFKEIGHAVQSVAGGNNVLCRCVIHFN